MTPRKTLTFLGADGAGKKTLMGNFWWKMGPNMVVVEKLEKNNIRRLDELQPFMEQQGLEMPVDLSPHAYYVVGPSQEPEVAVWVVDATSSDAGEAPSQELASSLSSGSLRPKEKLLILINKMDKIKWSEPEFNAIATRFQGLACLPTGTAIIPVSGFEGTNLVEVPEDITWMKQSPIGGNAESGIVLGKCLADFLY